MKANPFARKRILLGYGIAMVLVSTVGVASFRSVHSLHENARMVAHTHLLLSGGWRLRSAVNEAIARSRGYLFSGSEDLLASLDGIVETMRASYDEIRSLSRDNPSQQQRLDELGPLLDKRIDAIYATIKVRRAQGLEAAAKAAADPEVLKLTQDIRDILSKFEDEEQRLLSARTVRADESVHEALFIVVFGSVLAVLLVVISSISVRRDFLALVRTEDELDKTIAFQKGVLDNAQCSIVTAYPNGTISSVNSTAERWLGYSAAELVDKNTPMIIHDPAEVEARARELSLEFKRHVEPDIGVFTVLPDQGQTETREWMYIRKDGSRFPVQLSVSCMYNRQGSVLGYIGVATDITKRKQAEQDWKIAAEAAVAASKAKSEFLANMSHELRTPLNSVIGFANVLRKNKSGALLPKDLAYLERIQDNGKHLLELINSILDLSKIEAGKMEPDYSAFDLGQLVRETLDEMQGQLQGRSVVLAAQIPDGMVSIESDRARLKQVIINLTANALKFTEQGSVTVSAVADGHGHPARLDVTDTGIGIPKEKLGAIFEAFQQAETGTARKYGGTGLGLTISRAICNMLGYRIRVRSEIGKGSVFSIELIRLVERRANPTGRVRSYTRSSATSKAVLNFKGKRILLIDDDMDSGIVFKEQLHETGCTLLQARSGSEGLMLARAEHPDLILLDLLMPALNGHTVLQALRERPETRDIPVIVVSIVADESAPESIPPEDRIQKPASRERLLEAIARHLASD